MQIQCFILPPPPGPGRKGKIQDSKRQADAPDALTGGGAQRRTHACNTAQHATHREPTNPCAVPHTRTRAHGLARGGTCQHAGYRALPLPRRPPEEEGGLLALRGRMRLVTTDLEHPGQGKTRARNSLLRPLSNLKVHAELGRHFGWFNFRTACLRSREAAGRGDRRRPERVPGPATETCPRAQGLGWHPSRSPPGLWLPVTALPSASYAVFWGAVSSFWRLYLTEKLN